MISYMLHNTMCQHMQKYVHMYIKIPVSSVCEGEQAEKEVRGRGCSS